MQSPKIWAIVPAAGQGARLKTAQPKQYLHFHGKALIEHTLSALLSYEPLEKCLVVVSKDDTHWAGLKVANHEKVERIQGGAERVHSVYQGLIALEGRAHQNDWVLVHDAARPLIQISEIVRLFSAIENHAVGGLLGAPVRDTLKEVIENHMVHRTLDRAQIWQALTPQIFRFGALTEALKQMLSDNKLVTDESQAIELSGGRPLIVACEKLNLKLTYPEDIKIFEQLLA